MIRIIPLVFILSLCAWAAFAQIPVTSSPPVDGKNQPANTVTENPRYVSKKEPVHIPKLSAPPVIDGVLNDEVWKNAAVFGDFLQTSPGDNVAPTHPTEFMMAYDAKNLYMAWRVTQDPSTVRAT